jgi:hypothetical protein
LNILIHGQAGTGKNRLCATATDPIILSAEQGLLSLTEFDLPAIEIRSIADFAEAFRFLQSSDEASQYQTICLDSLSELAEIMLSEQKERNKDARMAYMMTQENIMKIIKGLKNLGRMMYCSAKSELQNDDGTGMSYFAPSFPGSKLSVQMPYVFDVVGAMRAEMADDGNVHRYVQTANDGKYIAKDRTGKLATFEEPDLGVFINKIFNKE